MSLLITEGEQAGAAEKMRVCFAMCDLTNVCGVWCLTRFHIVRNCICVWFVCASGLLLCSVMPKSSGTTGPQNGGLVEEQ